MFSRLPLTLLSLCLLASSSLFVGCQRQSGPVIKTVTGTATFNGKPIEEGEILFRPEDGKSSGGGSKISGGQFSFQAPIGLMRVEINGFRVVPGKYVEPNPGEKAPLVEQYLPKKFNEESELKAEVSPETTEFKFDLSDAPGNKTPKYR